MVLIMRAAALKPFGASIKLTTISVFVETLTTMAVGAAIGALIVLNMDVPHWLQWMGILTAICAVTPTLPWIFRPILKFRLPTDDPLSQALDEDYNGRLMLKGWFLSGCSWLFLGTSLYFAVLAIPIANAPGATADASTFELLDRLRYDKSSIPTPELRDSNNMLLTYPLQRRDPFALWVICLAACALSVVAGFVSMLPGGAGVRELVLLILLTPIVGHAAALVVAIAHRLATITGELIVAAISVAIDRYANRSATITSDTSPAS
jgi:hypothetical protein